MSADTLEFALMLFSIQVKTTQVKTCSGTQFIQQMMHFALRILCITEFRHAQIKVLWISNTLELY